MVRLTIFIISCCQHCNVEPNRTPFREAGGIPIIFKVLQQLPFPAPELEVVKNTITAVALLAAEGMYLIPHPALQLKSP